MNDRREGNGLTQRERLLLEIELVNSQERVRSAKSDLKSRFRSYTEEVARMKALEQMLCADRKTP